MSDGPHGDANEERRRYFRIDDTVRLTYRVVTKDQVEEGLRTLEEGAMEQFTLMSSLTNLNSQMSVHMRRIQHKDPDVALYLKALDQKIELLAHAVVSADAGLLTQQGMPVNLSAGGISLDVAETFEPGQLLEIKMLLLPSFTGLLTYAEVVRCEEPPEEVRAQGFGQRLHLAFVRMREQDQDLLIKHILRRQGDQLRAEREGEED